MITLENRWAGATRIRPHYLSRSVSLLVPWGTRICSLPRAAPDTGRTDGTCWARMDHGRRRRLVLEAQTFTPIFRTVFAPFFFDSIKRNPGNILGNFLSDRGYFQIDLDMLTSRLSSREPPRCVATFLGRCRQWQKAQDRLVDDGFALGHSPSEFTHHYFSCWSLWWEGSFNESHSCRAHRPPPVFPHPRVWKTDFNPPSMPQFSFHMSSPSPIFLALTSLIYQAVLTRSPFNSYKSHFAFVLPLSVSFYAPKTGWTANSVPPKTRRPILWMCGGWKSLISAVAFHAGVCFAEVCQNSKNI